MQVKRVLVTGANGFVGNATAKYFALQGWKTYGMIRNPHHATDLITNEIIPIVGSYSDTSTLDSLKDIIFDVIISTTEDWSDYTGHFDSILHLVHTASQASNAANKKPLLIFTSGNKDYGPSGLDGSPSLTWISEDSPLLAPSIIATRARTSLRVYDHPSHFHAAILRPCMIYGRKSSIYGTIMAQAASPSKRIIIPAPPNTIWHGIHVDDVASAYFALATRIDPASAHGQAYTVANDKYDALQQLAEGIAAAYGGGMEIVLRARRG